jgi:transposase-like protein
MWIAKKRKPCSRCGCKASTGSCLTLFLNLAPRLKSLVTRRKRGAYGTLQRADTPRIRDNRGQVVRRVGTPQTFLTPSEVTRLVEDYQGGAGVARLAQVYGIHRSTVCAHLNRRGVVRRVPGLGAEETAEAVRLHEQGLSLRAIARTMGINRRHVAQAVRATSTCVLVQVKAYTAARTGRPGRLPSSTRPDSTV